MVAAVGEDEPFWHRAGRLVEEAARWRMSAAHWAKVDAEVDRLGHAVDDRDEEAVRRAVEELEMLGPSRSDTGEAAPPNVIEHLRLVAYRLRQLAS